MNLLHTYYKIASVTDYPGAANDTPIYTPDGQLIAMVPARFAFDLSLEGSGKLADGRVVNYASSGGTCQSPPGYQGIRSCYRVLSASQYPWGEGHGVPVEPLRSIAVDSSFIPYGSVVYIQEFDGLQIPEIGGVGGFVHDGLFRAEDSGGGILGNHIDIYAGPTAMYRWLDSQIPTSYANGSPLHATIRSASEAPLRDLTGHGGSGTSSDTSYKIGTALFLGALALGAGWYLGRRT